MADTDHDKEPGRLLHDRLAAAFGNFCMENGKQDVNVVIGAFLSCAIQAVHGCEDMALRNNLVLGMVRNIVEMSGAFVGVKMTIFDPAEIAQQLKDINPAGRA